MNSAYDAAVLHGKYLSPSLQMKGLKFRGWCGPLLNMLCPQFLIYEMHLIKEIDGGGVQF